MNHDTPTAVPQAGTRQVEGALTDVGPYRVVSLLGEGGFGQVYLAEQSEPIRRHVALKVIKAGMDSRAVIARFEAERQALAMMDHPGVAKVFDAGVSGAGRPYFAMEFVHGAPIARFCHDERLGVEARVELMIQVCEAVQHAHMKGVIHRDLKPGNVLVGLVDGKPHAKVIDFGVAKALYRPLTDSTLVTEHGQMVGTPEYMSPEQARGSAVDVDTRADVYSLGAILYELLTGVPPLESRDLRKAGYAAIQKTIEEMQPVRPSERVTRMGPAEATSIMRDADPTTLSRRLREDLDWIVLKCLEKERSRRYDSAGALGRDLRRYLNDEPVLASPPSVGYRARKFVKRHKGAVAAAVAVGVTLVAGVIGTSIGLSWALRERGNARAQADAAVKARDEAEAVTAFLSDMLASVDPEERGKGGGGRDVTVKSVMDQAARGISTRFVDRPLVEARLRHTMGNAYMALGLHEAAEKQLPLVVEIRKRTVGEEHADTLNAVANLGALRHAQARYDEALALFRQAEAGFSKLGEQHRERVLGMQNNTAQIYARRGMLTEAERMQRRVVDGYRELLGAEHERTLGCTVNLASLLDQMGKREEAAALLLKTVDGFTRTKGAEDPRTLLAQYNLADVWRRVGKREDGGKLMRRVLEVRVRVLGEDHPQTIAARSGLALVLKEMGRLAEAEKEYASAWESGKRVWGDDHDDTHTIVMNLMTLYEALEWPERSRGLVEELVPLMKSAAEGGAATANELNSYAWFLLTVKPEGLRDAGAALRASSRAVDMDRAAGGRELWQYLDSLALAQFRIGDAAGAAKSQREAISLLTKENEGYRGEMEGRLKEYEAGASGTSPR